MRHFKKPFHKKEVVATSQGWVVKETGELLVSVKGLDNLLEQHKEPVVEPSVSDSNSVEEETNTSVQVEEEVAVDASESVVEEVEEVTEQPKKRRGRKPKK